MGVVPITLIVLALKLPILGMIWFVWWAMKEPSADAPPEDKVRAQVPPGRDPDDPRRGPRRRGPHGGQAQAQPSPRRDPHPATPRESVPGPLSRST